MNDVFSKIQQKGLKIKIPTEVCDQSIDWYKCSPKIKTYLKKHNFKTVRETIDRQNELPADYWLELKCQLSLVIFGNNKKGE